MSGDTLLLRVRPVELGDAAAWATLRTELWPASPQDHPREIRVFLEDRPEDAACFVAEEPSGRVVGFVEVGLRPFAEGCTTRPVGYLEGIYVSPEYRRSGAGGALVEAGEGWARARGCREMASDRALEDRVSKGFHLGCGFAEVARIVCYRKTLDGDP